MKSETATSPYSSQTGLARSESIGSLFLRDTLAFTRYFDDRRSSTLLEPEKRLMLAILKDALYSFQDNYSARRGNKKRLFDNVQRWIFQEGGDWVFSFENICGVLGFNPGYIRKGFVHWREKELSKHRTAPLFGTEQSKRRSPASRCQVPGGEGYTAVRSELGLKRQTEVNGND